MNLRDLEYVVAIARFENMGKAAEHCNVSQSTLSIQLKKLEEYLGVVIFERSNKQISLTPAGESVLEVAQGMMNDAKRLRDIAKAHTDPFAGEFRLGAFPTLAPYLLPKIVPVISRAFPTLVPLLVEEKSPVLVDKLQKGTLDASLLALPVHEKNLQSVALFDEPFLLACHRSHSLAKRKSISNSDLEGESLLLLEDGHCLRDQALQVCYMSNAKEHQEFRATSMETLRHMVAANVGITLIPKLACISSDDVVYVPFVKQDIPSRTIGLVWRNTSTRKQVLDALVKELKKIRI